MRVLHDEEQGMIYRVVYYLYDNYWKIEVYIW